LIAEQKIPPLIIVGIDNTKNRACEYIPYRSKDPRVLKPQGKCYPDFLQREVMPLIEERYSILKGPENTGLGGSSLGGLITLYTQLAVPGVFGRLLIESPSLFVANRKILEESRRARGWPQRMYLGVGTRETGQAEKDERVVGDVRELEAILREAGLDETRLKVHVGKAPRTANQPGRRAFRRLWSFSIRTASRRRFQKTKLWWRETQRAPSLQIEIIW
jgi:enterochelin esterase-like enzyme